MICSSKCNKVHIGAAELQGVPINMGIELRCRDCFFKN